MPTAFSDVYPRSPVPLTIKILQRFPFYFDSRRDFFEKSFEEGNFEEGSVTMILAPRIFGKTSFINMLPRFLQDKGDKRDVCSYSCMDNKQLDQVRVAVDEMLRGCENRILVLDEMNYAIERESLWRKIVELAGNISQMKGWEQTIILTTSETSSSLIKEAFNILHPGVLRLPALNEIQTKLVASGVLKEVSGRRKIPHKLLDLVWSMSGGIPPYIRILLLQVYRSFRKDVDFSQLPTICMFDFFDNLDAIESCIQTLTRCPIETARMYDRDLVLMADQFCSSCPIRCRTSSVEHLVVDTSLAHRYGLAFTSSAIAPPIAFYFNDYLGRRRFAEFSSDILNRWDDIRIYVDAYGRKEFINEALFLLEIAYWKSSMLHENLDATYIVRFLRDKAELIFLERLPTVEVVSRWIEDFNSVCRATVYGDKGIDLEIHNLKLSAEMPAINSYVQCKNWKSKIDLTAVGILHKFEMILRTTKQIHAAILVSTSKIDDAMIEEAKTLTKESKSVFSCWGEPELTTIISAACGKHENVQRAIKNLSRAELPTKAKGGALEYLTLKTFSILAEWVIQR